MAAGVQSSAWEWNSLRPERLTCRIASLHGACRFRHWTWTGCCTSSVPPHIAVHFVGNSQPLQHCSLRSVQRLPPVRPPSPELRCARLPSPLTSDHTAFAALGTRDPICVTVGSKWAIHKICHQLICMLTSQRQSSYIHLQRPPAVRSRNIQQRGVTSSWTNHYCRRSL